MNENYNNQIIEIVKEFPTSYSTIIKLKSSNKYLYDYVMESTQLFPDLPFPTRIYYILSGQKEYVKCKVCGNDIPHDRKCNALTGYASLCCSRPCAQLDPDHKVRQREKSMRKYGVPHPNQAPENRYKASETKKNASPEKKAEILAKQEATFIRNYGVKYPSQCKAVADKMRLSWKNKTEEELAERDRKTKATKKLKYGDENYRNVEKLRQTRQLHKIEDPDFEKKALEKREHTCMDVYGVKNISQNNAIKTKIAFKKYLKAYYKYYKDNPVAEPLFTAEEYASDPDAELLWKCRTCGKVFRQRRYASTVKIVRCYDCEPLLHNVSKAEKQLLDFIKSIYSGNVIENSRKIIPPQEIDIYLPDLKLAIEYDGLYWHSEDMGTPSDYHLNKTKACEALGLRLIHVFESDWRENPDLVRDSIRRAIGVSLKAFNVSELVSKEVSPPDAVLFHSCSGVKLGHEPVFSFGAYDGDKLVACVSFEKSRLCKAAEYELIATSFAVGYDVRGIIDAAVTAFDNLVGYHDIVRYVNRAFESPEIYVSAGFELDHMQQPTPWYWDYGHANPKLLSRHEVRKPEFLSSLKRFDPSKTDEKNLADNRIMRVYDCGNVVFIRRASK